MITGDKNLQDFDEGLDENLALPKGWICDRVYICAKFVKFCVKDKFAEVKIFQNCGIFEYYNFSMGCILPILEVYCGICLKDNSAGRLEVLTVLKYIGS